MTFKELALKAEEEFDFDKALEYYKKAENELSLEDNSLIRFAELLYDFQEYDYAETIFEKILSQKDDVNLSLKLAEIYEENKKIDKAIEIYKKYNKEDKIKELTDKKSFEIPSTAAIRKFLSLFSGREDVFAIQLSNSYKPIRRSLNYKDIAEHLSGKKTVGVYQLKKDTSIKFAAYDVDIKKTFLNNEKRYVYEENAKTVAKKLFFELNSEGIKSYLEYTGNRGYHIWIFFDEPILSYKVKPVMETILNRIELEEGIDVEIFPKQIELHGGLGNLIKVPLGIHRKTNKKCLFVDTNFENIRNQISYLMEIEENPKSVMEALYKEIDEEELSLKPLVKKQKIKRSKSSSQSVKRHLRRTLGINSPNEVEIVIAGCHILSQIVHNIEQKAFISEEEEEILVKSLINFQMGEWYLKNELKKTVNFSQKRFNMLIKRAKGVPITCEEIRKIILNKGLSLDLEKCVCKFNGGFNSPYAIATDLEKLFSEKISLNDILKKIVKKNQEKFEIEKEISNLKKMVSKKMGDQKEVVTEMGTIKKHDDGSIEIIL